MLQFIMLNFFRPAVPGSGFIWTTVVQHSTDQESSEGSRGNQQGQGQFSRGQRESAGSRRVQQRQEKFKGGQREYSRVHGSSVVKWCSAESCRVQGCSVESRRHSIGILCLTVGAINQRMKKRRITTKRMPSNTPIAHH